MQISRIGQIAVVVHDVARATAFYRDVLGLRHLFDAPPGLAFFECGGVRLMLTLPQGDGADRASSIVYYVVDDITEAHRSLVARGVTFLHDPRLVAPMPDHDLWMAFLSDGEGNTVALMSEVRR